MRPFINGEFARFVDEVYFESINPRDGKTLTRLVQCGETEVNAAVAAAIGRRPLLVGVYLVTSGPGILMRSRGKSRPTPDCLPSWKVWTTENRSVNRADIDIPLVSPVLLLSSRRLGPAAERNIHRLRAGRRFAAKSFHGISHY